jgi:hypothetical protein
MAYRVDDGEQPTAHTAIQAMIVRGQQAADQTGKPVGVHYDLAADQVSLVEIGPDMPAEIVFLRVAVPADGASPAPVDAVAGNVDDPSPEVKAASV